MKIRTDQLRWTVGGDDVTCWNCHTALYKPDPETFLCRACQHALLENTLEIHARRLTEQMSQKRDVTK